MIAFFSYMLATAVFSSVTVLGFGYFTVKFPTISFVVMIRIIRNVIVSWICSWYVKLL